MIVTMEMADYDDYYDGDLDNDGVHDDAEVGRMAYNGNDDAIDDDADG